VLGCGAARCLRACRLFNVVDYAGADWRDKWEKRLHERQKMTQRKLSRSEVKKLNNAKLAISTIFDWTTTKIGYVAWDMAWQHLDNMVLNETNDGLPWVDVEQAISEQSACNNHSEITLRDLFAAKAMAVFTIDNSYEISAEMAYKQADALLIARKAKNDSNT